MQRRPRRRPPSVARVTERPRREGTKEHHVRPTSLPRDRRPRRRRGADPRHGGRRARRPGAPPHPPGRHDGRLPPHHARHPRRRAPPAEPDPRPPPAPDPKTRPRPPARPQPPAPPPGRVTPQPLTRVSSPPPADSGFQGDDAGMGAGGALIVLTAGLGGAMASRRRPVAAPPLAA